MTIKDLDGKRSQILELARRHGATNVRVFGSVARQESSSKSDLDVLIELAAGRTLLDQVALKQDLEELLHCPVDVVVEGGISPHLKDLILAEAVPLGCPNCGRPKR